MSLRSWHSQRNLPMKRSRSSSPEGSGQAVNVLAPLDVNKTLKA